MFDSIKTFQCKLEEIEEWRRHCCWIFPSLSFSLKNTPTILKPSSFFTPTCLWRWNRQWLPKRRLI